MSVTEVASSEVNEQNKVGPAAKKKIKGLTAEVQ